MVDAVVHEEEEEVAAIVQEEAVDATVQELVA